MTDGRFADQLNRIEKLLKGLGLTELRILKPDYSGCSASEFRKLRYVDRWRKCYTNEWYDFQLIDFSLLQLLPVDKSSKNGDLRFAYYECPYSTMSYAEFVVTNYGEHVKAVGDLFRKEYEEYVASLSLKDSFTPIRYDYCVDQYRACVHPVSHFHIGHNSDIRISVHFILTPLAFVLFVLRQCYPDHWSRLISKPLPKWIVREIRDALDRLPKEYLTELNAHQLHLS